MFEPWIGKEYDSQKDFPKTLILGESHYGNHHEGRYELSKKTIYCIDDQIQWNNSYPFFTRLVSSLTGKKPNFEEKGEFWHKVAYHNLITEPLKGARRYPTVEQWEKSIETIPSVIEELKPKYCIVLGYRMWWRLHNRFDLEPCTSQYDAGPCGVVYSPSMNCYFHGMKHPSGRGFINAEWCSWIDNFIKEKWPNKSFQRTEYRR